MAVVQKVLLIDAATSYYKVTRYSITSFMGPIDLGLHLAGKYNSLNIGIGLLAGSIFPGSNRLFFSGFSPCWGGFYISSMGGAGLVFDNLGINMISIINRAASPSIIYLNRVHGEEIEVELAQVDIGRIWEKGKGGVYSLMDHLCERYGSRYENDPRTLATGPAALATDIGGIVSAPVKKGAVTFVDTWAGRGGLGTKMLRDHGIAGIIYGGTFIDEDFRNRKVVDEWFENKYNKKLAAADFEATTKYRFDPKFATGGTFGVNFAKLGGQLLFFNYKSIYMEEDERLKVHKELVVDHYLRQFNEETIKTKQFRTCGEPCAAVCKKLKDEYKKDYEPYQSLGPLCGVFDQRAAEKLVHHADMLGFDAIAIGGVLSWLMECMADGIISYDECGIKEKPHFNRQGFSVETDSAHNAEIGVQLLDGIIEQRKLLRLDTGGRRLARHIAREKGKAIIDRFVYIAFGRRGWMVPNQYWVPGVLSPMPIMGKYYMYYGTDFLPPRELGRKNAERFKKELILDTMGMCRFHRKWAEDMLPDVVGTLYGLKNELLLKAAITATRINSRNASIFWESERNTDYIHAFLKRKHIIDGEKSDELLSWIDKFEKDKTEAALNFWYEIHKGIHESLQEFR
jgi:glyceraldehyde-3-phosphate dehydrogenase (ferredoxin)